MAQEELQVSFQDHSLLSPQIPFCFSFKLAYHGINFLVKYILTKSKKVRSCFILEQFYSFPIASLLSLLRMLVFSLLKLDLPV